MGIVAANSLVCLVSLALVALVGAGVTEGGQGLQKLGYPHGPVQLTITDTDTQTKIDLFRLLQQSSSTGDAYSSIASKVQIDVEPVARFGVLSLILQRVPPLISDDFEATGDSAARSTRNIFMYCFYSGYVRSDQIARNQTYVHAQLCPEFVVTVNVHRGAKSRSEAQRYIARISLTNLSQHGVKVEWNYSSTTVPKIAPRFSDNAVSDKFLHVSDFTQLPKLAEKQVQFDTRMRQSFDVEAASHLAQTLLRKRREVGKNSLLQLIDMETSRFIELYAILDSGAYAVMRKHGASDHTEVKRRVGEIVALTNAMMSSVNIWVVLVGVEIWTTAGLHRFKYNYSDTEVNGVHMKALDGSATIMQLGTYRVDDLLNKHNRSVDHIHLFTNETLPNGYAALALIDEFCFWKSATISSLSSLIQQSSDSYTIRNSEYIAVALAHELGHSLGLNHDDPLNGSHVYTNGGPQDEVVFPEDVSLLESQTTGRCRCDAPRNCCVMWPSIMSDPFPPRWSSCSKRRLTKPPPNYPMDICLRNRPRFARYDDQPSTCGDFVVDRSKGEQCDCGPNNVCERTDAARCCNPNTCRFRNSTFQCANGPCCNTSTCSYANAKTVCRSAINSCDLSEVCSGRTAECVRNAHKVDGTECKDEMNQEGYCLGGWCRTVGHQCRAILGSLASQPTVLGPNNENYCSRYAHCRHLNRDRELKPESYSKCLNNQNDSSYGCTKLACEALAKYDSATVQRIGMYIHSVSRRVRSCNEFLKETGLNYPCSTHCYYFEGDDRNNLFMRSDFKFDPRMVPDGTKCGEKKMCMNQQCRSIDSFKFSKCSPPCQDGEVCDNFGQCQLNEIDIPEINIPAITSVIVSTVFVGVFLALGIIYLRRSGKLKHIKESISRSFTLRKSILLDRSGRARHRSAQNITAVIYNEKPIVMRQDSLLNNGRAKPSRPSRPPSISRPVLQDTSMDLSVTPLLATQPIPEPAPSTCKKISSPLFHSSTSDVLKSANDCSVAASNMTSRRVELNATKNNNAVADPISRQPQPDTSRKPPLPNPSRIGASSTSLEDTKTSLIKLLQDTFPDRVSPDRQPPSPPRNAVKPSAYSANSAQPKFKSSSNLVTISTEKKPLHNADQKAPPPPAGRKPAVALAKPSLAGRTAPSTNLNAQLLARFEKP